jgi:type II secretory pathway pseudopilin PulG
MTELRHYDHPDELGFTLVELLITISIMVIVIGALAMALIAGLSYEQNTVDRLSASHDTELTASFFSNDAASSDTVSTGSLVGACGTVPGTSFVLVTFSWEDPAPPGSTTGKVSTYVWNPPLGTAPGTITRNFCVGGTLNNGIIVGGTQTNAITVVHQVASSTTPTISCPPAASCTSTPAAVVLNVTEPKPTQESSTYTFSVIGERRPG